MSVPPCIGAVSSSSPGEVIVLCFFSFAMMLPFRRNKDEYILGCALINQSINQFIVSHASSVDSNMKISNPFILCVTDSTHGANAPLIRATHTYRVHAANSIP